ncbi:MAG: hypothetical protein ACXWG1_17880 [Usitatibacter sp.]
MIVPVPVALGPLTEVVTGAGVTGDVSDEEPVPAELVAVTEQEYATPLVSPVTVIGEAGPVALNAPGSHVAV